MVLIETPIPLACVYVVGVVVPHLVLPVTCTGPITTSAAATELDHLLEPGEYWSDGPVLGWGGGGGEYWVKLKLNVLACELAEM